MGMWAADQGPHGPQGGGCGTVECWSWNSGPESPLSLWRQALLLLAVREYSKGTLHPVSAFSPGWRFRSQYFPGASLPFPELRAVLPQSLLLRHPDPAGWAYCMAQAHLRNTDSPWALRGRPRQAQVSPAVTEAAGAPQLPGAQAVGLLAIPPGRLCCHVIDQTERSKRAF